jgi:hypothetical protein
MHLAIVGNLYFELRSADAEEKLLDETVQAYSRALGLIEYLFEGGAVLNRM